MVTIDFIYPYNITDRGGVGDTPAAMGTDIVGGAIITVGGGAGHGGYGGGADYDHYNSGKQAP